MKTIVLPFLLLFVLVTSCSRNRIPSAVYQKTAKHRIIAVLPAEMIYTGTAPKNAKAEDLSKMEESESRIFQQFLHDNILQNGNNGKYALSVSVQNYTNTLQLLTENNISLQDSWHKSDEELCKILKVDALIRMKIQKKRYMSDGASMGIDYGRQVLGAVLKRNVYAPSKTNDIFASCSIVSNGETVWNDNYRRATDWDTPTDLVVNNITENFAYHIPYRQRQ
ncbi:MAG TPA: hypothetical protein VMZ03_04560 [Chitinophagaceae bacterium]|nr:hypothetical protein [Chitinophagaceae bacterium]